MASVSSAGRESRDAGAAARQLHEPRRDLRARHQAEAAAHLDDLAARGPASSQRGRQLSTSARAASADSRSSTSWMRAASTGASEAKSSASTTSMIGLGHSDASALVHGRRLASSIARAGSRTLSALRSITISPKSSACRARAWPSRTSSSSARSVTTHSARMRSLPATEENRSDHVLRSSVEDLAHPLEHRERVRLHLAAGRWRFWSSMSAAARAGAGAPRGPRAGRPRAAAARRRCGRTDQRLLGLALGEPGAERLDARVLAQPLGQLLLEQLPSSSSASSGRPGRRAAGAWT